MTILLLAFLALSGLAALAGALPRGVAAGPVPGPLPPGRASRTVAPPTSPAVLLSRAAPILCLPAGLALMAAGAMALWGPPSPALALPVLPGGVVLLRPDGLSGWFLMLLGLLAAASGPDPEEPDALRRALSPIGPALLALALSAADAAGLLLALGLALPVLVFSTAQLAYPRGRAVARRGLASALAGWVALLLAFALLLPMAPAAPGAAMAPALPLEPAGWSFASLRQVPPEGWRAGLLLVLALAGAAPLLGASSMLSWMPLLATARPGRPCAALPALMVTAGLYLLARLLLDLTGPAQPGWWGLPTLLAGAAMAFRCGLRASLEDDLRLLPGWLAGGQAGLAVLGLGLAAIFRAADLSALAALASGGALLQAGLGLPATLLLVLVAEEVRRMTGFRSLERLGGLVRVMPWATGCAALAVLALAALPPFAGFAPAWVLLQALLAAWRVGEIGTQFAALAVLAAAGAVLALLALAALRFLGLAFLGRPRHPRTLGGGDVTGVTRGTLLLLAVLLLLGGILPGPLLELMGPALRLLVRADLEGRAGWLAVQAGDGAASYQPLAVAALLLLPGGIAALALRALGPPPVTGPVWDDGFMAPPPHLPFGDPATQPGGRGFAQPLRRLLGVSPAPGEKGIAQSLARWQRLPVALAAIGPWLASAPFLRRPRRLSARGELGLGLLLAVVLLLLASWLGGRG
ncbi:Formate hydrogenlyase subunit 3 [Roseomonas mucosa]|uniref:proton-conducting transporter transmembrane domain-containing protein n=3 Tax=Pseudomonadota TaxID=1224 RepID=UPI000C198669|nr:MULTISPECIES: proton-conducting transporter membrane subunit [Roseomonas]ATR21801.1 hypothetical protein CTJ15_16835 [Roseomonas sp. FDAARGOS_362]USQ70016.1 hypothetical protein NF552_10455 [Roseomonas mucosa]UZO95754.1 Formate hydrogenlyase subunit 3 [Roseomonas mucosa]